MRVLIIFLYYLITTTAASQHQNTTFPQQSPHSYKMFIENFESIGKTENHKDYQITATKALEIDSNTYQLTNVRILFQSNLDIPIKLVADTAYYLKDKHILNCQNNVQVLLSKQRTLYTQEISILLNNGSAKSIHPTKMIMADQTIESSRGFTADLNNETVKMISSKLTYLKK